MCDCAVCKHLDSLKLKIVVHSGVAVFHEIAGRPQVSGVDIDQCLDVAEWKLENQDKYKSLGLWVMRDQIITPAQAARICKLYFAHIESMKSDFDLWHFAWAIRNLYDGGSAEVQAAVVRNVATPIVPQPRVNELLDFIDSDSLGVAVRPR